MNIIINLPKVRTSLGTIKVVDKANVVVTTSICLGLSDNGFALSFKNPSKDPLRIGGNTPYGGYRCTIDLFKNPTESQLHSYGPYGIIHLDAISGDGLTACAPLNKQTLIGGRTGLLIHSGVLNPAYTSWKGLRPTHGCVRVLDPIMEIIFKSLVITPDIAISCNIFPM